ncbi:MAG: hypothetical protein ACR2QE_12055 [Acidimicrobiales bacterium]
MRTQLHSQRRWPRFLAVAAVALALMSTLAAPVSAQTDETGSEEDDVAIVRISDEANENRIDQAVLGLLIIAFSLAVLTLLFWWHTQPSRRARVLAARTGPSGVVDADPTPEGDPDG